MTQPPSKEATPSERRAADEMHLGGAPMPPRGDARGAIFGGCLASIASATLTCGLLFINGSLVLGALEVVSTAGAEWASHTGFRQFTLFVVPVALAVIQWMMLDYLRTRIFSRRSSHRSPEPTHPSPS